MKIIKSQTVPDSWRSNSSAPANCSHPTLNIPAMPSNESDFDVGTMQGLLLARGFGPDGLTTGQHRPDGMPGSGTERELRDFQRALTLTADAICGPDTWKALFS